MRKQYEKDLALIHQYLTSVGGKSQWATAVKWSLGSRTTSEDWHALYIAFIVATGVEFALNQQQYLIDADNSGNAKATDDDKLKGLMTKFAAGYAGARVGAMLAATQGRVLFEVDKALQDGATTDHVRQALDETYAVLASDGAANLAEFETVSAGNAGMDIGAGALGIGLSKTWLALSDGKTREWHAEMDGVTVDYNEPFEVDGEQLMYPTDTSLGASGRNIYNCRCMSFTQPAQ